MTSSVSLPADRFGVGYNSASVLTGLTGVYVDSPVLRGAWVKARRAPKPLAYNEGLLNSFSVYSHTTGLHLGVQKTLQELLEDMRRYTFDAAMGVDLEEYALFTDDVRLAETQTWTRRTYTLAAMPNTSLPHFPEEDFES